MHGMGIEAPYLRPRSGTRYLEASYGIHRIALLKDVFEAYRFSGSGGLSWVSHNLDFVDIEMR